MSRVGWVVLALVALVVAAFVSVTRFGAPLRQRPAPRAAVATGTTVFAVPVAGVARASIQDTWGHARSQGRVHHGTDIMAPGGTPVLAVADGTIEKLYQSRLGGTTLYERSPDRRWTYYYAHLSGYAAGLAEGAVVRAGQQIAQVGDTGDAGPGNYHLHFGLTRTRPDQHWYEGEDVNAYPYLVGAPLPR